VAQVVQVSLMEKTMTAKHSKLPFLHSFNEKLEHHVLNLSAEGRRSLFLQCISQISAEIALEPEVSDALALLSTPNLLTQVAIAEMNLASEKWLSKSIDLDEVGDEVGSMKCDQVGATLASIATYLEREQMSALDLDQCLYYLDFLLAENKTLSLSD
jgi:hypothetical protein